MANGAPANRLNGVWVLWAPGGSHPHIRSDSKREDAGATPGPQGKQGRVQGCLKLSVNDAGLELLTFSIMIYLKNNLKF